MMLYHKQALTMFLLACIQDILIFLCIFFCSFYTAAFCHFATDNYQKTIDYNNCHLAMPYSVLQVLLKTFRTFSNAETSLRHYIYTQIIDVYSNDLNNLIYPAFSL